MPNVYIINAIWHSVEYAFTSDPSEPLGVVIGTEDDARWWVEHLHAVREENLRVRDELKTAMNTVSKMIPLPERLRSSIPEPPRWPSGLRESEITPEMRAERKAYKDAIRDDELRYRNASERRHVEFAETFKRLYPHLDLSRLDKLSDIPDDYEWGLAPILFATKSTLGEL